MLKKTLHIFVAFLIFFASAGITISKHYCGDQVMEVSLFKQADNCGEHEAVLGNVSCSIQKKDVCREDSNRPDDCCSDEIDFKKTDLFKENSPDLFLSVFTVPTNIIFDDNITNNTFNSFPNQPPPLIGPDIILLGQSFLC